METENDKNKFREEIPEQISPEKPAAQEVPAREIPAGQEDSANPAQAASEIPAGQEDSPNPVQAASEIHTGQSAPSGSVNPAQAASEIPAGQETSSEQGGLAPAPKKSRAGKILRPVGFALLMLAIVFALSNLLAAVIPDTDRDGQARGFYAEPKNSLDVVAIGNSDLYSGVSPMKLYEDYGYASYVCSEAHQTMDGSYTLLTEVLSCQRPKLVILETDNLFEKAGDVRKQTIRFFQKTFPLFRNHTFWKGFKSVKRQVSGTKGYKYTEKIVPYEGGDYMTGNEHMGAVVGKGTRKFLDKFIAKCRDTGTPLLLLELPSTTSWSHSRARVMWEIAEANGIPFIDLNLLTDEIALDWRADSRDGGNHLNYRGAHKATAYLGAYLASRYDLPDRRPDPAYSRWDIELDAYRKLPKE